MGLIYLATSRITGMSYVGQTSVSLEIRRRGHENEAKSGSNRIFAKAIREQGAELFYWKIVKDHIPDELLMHYEGYEISRCGTLHPAGYNSCRVYYDRRKIKNLKWGYLYHLDELSSYLGVSQNKLKSWITSGELIGRKFGGCGRGETWIGVYESDLEVFIEARTYKLNREAENAEI